MDHPWQAHFPGRYVERDSLLHSLDPRSKLLALPALVVASFALRGVLELSVLGLALLLLLRLARSPLQHYLRLLLSLRFLLGFTLVVYLLFTPGYTLFGLSWLSRDGLTEGGRVCAQLALALGFSFLLSLTTTPQALAAGSEALLSPLRRFGVPVSQIGDALRLVLYFIDQTLLNLATIRRPAASGSGLRERLRRGATLLAKLLVDLLEQADDLARRLSRGEPLPWGDDATPLPGLRGGELVFMTATVALLVLLGGIGSCVCT